MPFSTTPVYVGNGDTVQLRYPTPSTWNTTVTVQVQIGTGTDPTGVTLGTRLPDAIPNAFTFADNSGSTIPTASSPTDFVSVFQRNTFYYSNQITVSGLELRVPISIASSAAGPKGSYPNKASSGFSINGGPYITESTQTVSVTGNTTQGSTTITNVSSIANLAVGRYISSTSISGEILSISSNTVTLTNPATATTTAANLTQYYTVTNGDTVRLRTLTENWYTTNTNVTLTISDNYWGANNAVSDTWSITTRAQLQQITSLVSGTFTDYVDLGPSDFSTYKTQNIPITGIDTDTVLRATATGDCQISKDGVNWSQSVTGLTINNTTPASNVLYTRIAVGSNYTTKTTGSVTVFAVPGETATISGGSYDNNPAATYGSGTFAVTQVTGTTNDNWQIWTEVDRYPNAINFAPIYTYTDSLPLATLTSSGTGYTNGNTYTTTNTTNPSATGLTVKVTTNPADGSLVALQVVERGTGPYTIDDILTVNGGLTNASLKLIQYRQVNVSSTNTLNNAEVGFYYYSDVLIGGLGTEYTTGTYSDLEAPLIARTASPNSYVIPAGQSGQTVQMSCIVSQGDGLIRKNNSGTWGTTLTVQNGDVVTIRQIASTSYNTSKQSQILIQGPPSGNPIYGNPTGGPNPPTFADKTATITVKTRGARTDPYPFRADHVYQAELGTQYIRTVVIDGLDLSTTATIVSQSPGANAFLSLDGTNYATSLTSVPASTTQLYVKITSSAAYNTTSFVTYKVGNTQDTLKVTTKRSDYTYQSFSPATSGYDYQVPSWADTIDFVLIGAGGGNGGDDFPNSFGGRGGTGNLITGQINLAAIPWPDPLIRTIKVFSPTKGGNGVSFSKAALGGSGGFGYATGGNGGSTATGEYSGSGGGGGGAAAITLSDGTLLVLAGGGAGAGGAGDDTTIPKASQNGNNAGNGPNRIDSLSGLTLTGVNGGNASVTGGGGGGGAGGGFGSAGSVNTALVDEFGGTIATIDLDANGGVGGGSFYKSSYVTINGSVENLGAGSNTDGFVYIGWPPQDFAPDPFGFVSITGASPNTQYESEYVQITGITGQVIASITSSGTAQQIRVCDDASGTSCGAWGNSAVVTNGKYVQIRMTTGGNYYTGYNATIAVGLTTVYWTIETGAPPDNTPNDFTIPPLTDQPLSTLVESTIIQITGINSAVNVTAGNGAEISICNGSICDTNWQATRQISNGQGFKVRLITSANYNTTVTTSVTVGSATPVVWSVSTGTQPDNTPTSFLFIGLSNQNTNTVVYSNSVTIQNIDNTIPFTITHPTGQTGSLPTIVLNDIDTGVSSITVSLYDVVKLKYTTSSATGDSKTFNITAGTYNTTWTVTNAGVVGTQPNPFLFPSITAALPNLTVNSNTITISGLGSGVYIGAYANANAKLSRNGAAFNTYSANAPLFVTNTDTLRVQLVSSGIGGFSVTTNVSVGPYVPEVASVVATYTTTFTVFTPLSNQEPILGQWYSGLNMVQTQGSSQVKFNTKFDGLPIGSIMPIFKDVTQADGWGNLNGKADSRYPGWILCDGSYVSPTDFPLLYSVLGTTYGANVGGDFRLPDMRNKKPVGTGPVDGNATSSPALIPDYGPAKTSANKSNLIPGSHGGLWYIDQIAAPSAQSIPQVITPGTGLTATDSNFFTIGTISTTGYTNVTGEVAFTTSGQTQATFSLKSTTLYETPNHQHVMLTGQADPPGAATGSKGIVFWNNEGGFKYQTPTSIVIDSNNASTGTANIAINIWGYMVKPSAGGYVELTSDNCISSTLTPPATQWAKTISQWGPSFNTGCLNIGGPGLSGTYLEAAWSTVKYNQTNIGTIGNINYEEINSYINLTSEPFATSANSASQGGSEYKFVGAVDIPIKTVSVSGYNPVTKNNHTHYLSLNPITSSTTTFSYGNVNDWGTAFGSTPTNQTVTLTKTWDALGLQVLPGKFTLNANKQLIPVPSLAPQQKVPLITTYTWVKWLIKAY
jgi:microcystin-dependent protein